MDKAVSHKELNKEYKEIKGLRREKERSAKKWVVNSQKAVDRILSTSTAKQEKLADQGARALFNSPPMLETPPKDSDEIIEEMTRKMMMRLPKHPDMLSPEEREKLDADEKERLAEQERDRIILKEIKESFDRIGLEYQSGNDKPPMEFAIGFSKTAREYYKAQQSVDRCNFFYEFQDLPKRDIAQLCIEVLEIKFHPDIVDYVHFHSCGNVRKAMNLIRSVEEIGRYKNLEIVSQADLDD